jgi:hypothetical protein
LKACASCGIRELIEEKPQDIGAYTSKEFQWSVHEVRETEFLDQFAFDDGTEPVAYQNHFKYRSRYYHLYGNLINTNGQFNVCPDCSHGMTKRQKPTYSLLNGLDYGQIDGLPKLSFLETLLLSKSTVHLKLVKLSWNGPTQMAIKGHCVCVPHDGVDAMENALPRNINDILCVKYFGPPEHMEAMKSRFKSLPQFQVSMEKVEAWLRVFKMIHSDYTYTTFDRNKIPNLDDVFTEGDVEREMETHSGDQTSDSFEYVLLENDNSTNAVEENVADFLDDVSKNLVHTHEENANGDIIEIHEEHQILNDIEGLGSNLLKSFPTLFLIPNNFTFTLQTTSLRHLLLFHDNRFAESQELLFYLFNVKMRHLTLSNTSMYVKSNPSSIEDVMALINDPNFEEKLRHAKSNPNSKAAKDLVQRLKRHLCRSSSRLPFTSFERNLHLSQLVAYCRHFGLPSWFVTISPAEMDSKLVLKMANGETECIDLKTRQKIVNSNPVAAAEVFYRTVNKVLEHLIGLPSTDAVRKDHPKVKSRTKGILGTAIAHFGVIETQGRGSLHIHIAVWTKISSATLEAVSHDSVLAQELSTVLDSMTCASVPLKFHIERKNREFSRRYGYEDTTVSPEDDDFEEQFEDTVNEMGTVYNYHNHSVTCRKGKFGKCQCRLCRPQALYSETHPVIITRNPDRSISSSTDIPPPCCELDLFHRENTRFLYWELKREPHLDENGDIDTSNGYMVEFNKTLTACLKCNTCVSLLGDDAQAKSATFYMIKYMTKDPIATASTLSIIIEAAQKQHIPSLADDAGTPSRNAKLLLQRILNRNTAQSEYGQTLCAAVLLGYDSSIKSHNSSWCFTTSAIDMVSQFVQENDVQQSNVLDDFSTEAEDASMIDTLKDIGDYVQNDSDGVVQISNDDEEGPKLKISTAEQYKHRGQCLKDLNLYEYGALIMETKRKEERTSKGAGRKRNETFDYDLEYRDETKVQTFRSKWSVPAIAGRSFPKFPGQRGSTTFKEKMAKNWAIHVAAIFFPWGKNCDDINPSFDSVSSTLSRWKTGTRIEQIRFKIIENYATGLSISASTHQMYAEYRGRFADRWSEEEKRIHRMFQEETVETTFDPNSLYDMLELQLTQPGKAKADEFVRESLVYLNTIYGEPVIAPKTQDFKMNLDMNVDSIVTSLQNSNFDEIHQELEFEQANFRPTPTTIAPPIRLNEQQKFIKEHIMTTLANREQLLLLVCGGPGTGKSTLVNSVIDELPSNAIACSAPTGIAASLLNNGHTINSLLRIPVSNFKPLKTNDIVLIQTKFMNVKILVIDEVSMMDYKLFFKVDQRLRQIMDKPDLPFGGISIILLGDFYQLPPVQGSPWYVTTLENANSSHDLEKSLMITIMKAFLLAELTLQQRSHDEIHSKNLEDCRDTDISCLFIVEKYRTLSRNDIDEFANATHIVASNEERAAINILMATRFAKAKGLPIIAWYKSPTTTTVITEEGLGYLYKQDHKLAHYFVKGAPCCILANINVNLLVANGTPGILHSLVLNPSSSTIDESRIAAAATGEIIFLSDAPIAVNIWLNSPQHQHMVQKWPREAKIPGDTIVIPLKETSTTTIKVGTTKKLTFNSFPFDLSFALTFHKAQGQTLKQVIKKIILGYTGCEKEA